jgi:DNA topoisomerase-1
LIDKIQERNYVKKTNVKGKSIKCIDFELEDVELSEAETKREFGNEKNKLVIQPLGELVIQFLLRHFDKLFQYGYTKAMEDTLDLIAKGDKVWHELCRECLGEITTLSAGLVQTKRETIKIDDDHTYMIGKFGPVIKYTQGEKTTFKSVKTDIDLDRLRRGGYELADIIAPKGKPGRSLGKYEKKDVILKNGRYGAYVEWNGNKKSIGSISEAVDDISLEDVIPLLKGGGHPSMVRTINNSTSIRHGQYGDYVFHKKPDWKKPQFLKLNDFIAKHGVDSYKTCELNLFTDWLKETHGV